MTKVSKFDASDYLKTQEQIAAYLKEAAETCDASLVRTAIDTSAKAISKISKAKGEP